MSLYIVVGIHVLDIKSFLGSSGGSVGQGGISDEPFEFGGADQRSPEGSNGLDKSAGYGPADCDGGNA